MKRIAIATLFGVAAGVICATLAAWGHLLTLTSVLAIWILLNRAVMGFAIGTSGLKLHWAWNGIVMGLVVGSIFSYFLFINVGVTVMLFNFIGNAVFGLLIEFFTTVVFKQAAFPAPGPMRRAAAA